MKAVFVLALCLVNAADMTSKVSPTLPEAIVTVESDSTWRFDLEADDWLTEEQIADLKEAFALYDVDGDGTIITKEFETFMKSLGQAHTQAELKHMTDKVDADCNGTIDFKEFLKLLIGLMKDTDAEEEFQDAYRVFDKDGDSYINLAELTNVMQTLGENMTDDDMMKMFKDADINADEHINYEEFLAMLTSK